MADRKEKETANIRDKALARALTTPHKPHKPLKAKAKTKTKKAGAAKPHAP